MAQRSRGSILLIVLGGGLLLASVFGEGVARAQDGGAADAAQPAQADLETEGPSISPDLTLTYDISALGGAYPQGDELSVFVDVVGGAQLDVGIHEIGADVAYLYDPFSTKSFNFTEESAPETSLRIVQWTHELGGRLDWSADWLDWLSTTLELRAGQRWAETPSDERRLFDVGGELYMGAEWNETGPFGRVLGEYFRRIYAEYYVSQRSIDQWGTEWQLEAGYSFGRIADLSLGYELRLTDYLDARYDELTAGGQVVRAGQSKSYLRHALSVQTVLRPSRQVRLFMRYTFQSNDSRDYDREMTGRDANGALEARFIRDYYDYDRHWLSAGARWSTPIGLGLEIYAEYWLRPFDTYIARDAGNRWLDETRVDHDFESGVQLTYELSEIGDHTVNLIGLVSHELRRSNMEREVSFATNFDVTRLFFGISVHN